MRCGGGCAVVSGGQMATRWVKQGARKCLSAPSHLLRQSRLSTVGGKVPPVNVPSHSAASRAVRLDRDTAVVTRLAEGCKLDRTRW